MALKQFTTHTKETAHDELFRYTSGRWLIDEEDQLSQRFLKFDIGKLCRLAASLLDEKLTCIHVDKLEGKSCRAFLLTMDDGRQLIAKIPYRISGAASYTTASEVATMKFCMFYLVMILTAGADIRPVHLFTTLPVPNVLAWNSESTNEVGAEYIIMEKIPGVTLAEVWDGLSSLERYNIIERILAMEKELASLEFPAYGALYLQDSVPIGPKRFPLPNMLESAELFCVGRNMDTEPCQFKAISVPFVRL